MRHACEWGLRGREICQRAGEDAVKERNNAHQEHYGVNVESNHAFTQRGVALMDQNYATEHRSRRTHCQHGFCESVTLRPVAFWQSRGRLR